MKKILSLILAGLMTLSCAAFVAADDAAVDAAVEQSNTAEDYAIEFLANYGIFKGTSAAELVADADASIQRYQMALFVSRISTGWVDDAQWEDGPANNSTFEDIGEEPANKYLGALSYANQNGIIEGYSATKFAPYDGITYRDALTMVVRTLGYKGLAYPWGYIQKAVELGLTADVNVAYTDNLTRGQVAVIIYNAMFAATKSGETLAKKIFGCDFGWEEIVIVASNESAFGAKGLRAADGYVAFKILDKDGKLGANTYYVKKSELGLNGDHDDEIQVGAAYLALFTIKDDIASMVDADSLNYKTVYNMGITDNAGEAVATMPIKATLADLKIVKEYQKSDIISATDKPEIIIYSVGTSQVKGEDGTRVAIDWNTQNILKWVDKDKDGKAIEGHWEAAWIYNPTLERYYEYVLDNKSGKVYINWMSDDEFVKFYKAAVEVVKYEYQEYINIGSDGVNADTAYAKLRLFDTTALMGLYKSYSIGQIYVDSKECKLNKNNVNHADGKKYPTYKITKLDGEPVYEQFIEKDHTAHEYLSSLVGKADKDGKYDCGYAWLNVADFVTTFYKEDGSFENGSIVLYNVNKTTGEIEIIKHITTKGSASDDADSYIATGVLKAYNTRTAEVNIDGQKYPLGYASLQGSIYGNVAENLKSMTLAAQSLDEFQMQYVTYVVVDGRVVDIDLRGQTSDIVVVLGYAGVTSDGYIAVYGYGSDDSTAHIYRIASYNGWKKGDYRYYPANAWTDEAFKAGTIYTITSYDAETNSYNVYTENSDMNGRADLAYYSFEFDRGYRAITKYKDANLQNQDGDAVIEKMSKDDKYFIVVVDYQGNANGVVYVRNGIIPNGWEVKGSAVVKANSGAYVIYAVPADITGFKNTAHEIGFVLYEKSMGAALSTAYDEAIGGDWYLLGSTQTEVRTFDILTGNRETCFVSNNIDLQKGHVYVTMNFGGARMIISELPDNVGCTGDGETIFTRIQQLYNEKDVDLARFVVTDDDFTFTKDTFSKLELAKALKISGTNIGDKISEKIADETIKGLSFYVISDNAGHYIEEVRDIKAGETYKGIAIYDCETQKAVVYILATDVSYNADAVDAGNEKNPLVIDSWKYLNNGKTTESSLNFKWNGKYTATKNGNDKIIGGFTKLGTATLYFNTLDENHGDIAYAGYLFGIDNLHGRSYFSVNDTNASVSLYEKDGTKVFENAEFVLAGKDGKISIETIDCDDCSLVTAVTVDLSKVTIKAGQKAYMMLDVDGGNGVTGNDVKVLVKFEADENGVVTVSLCNALDNLETPARYVLNNKGVDANSSAVLNNIDLQLNDLTK